MLSGPAARAFFSFLIATSLHGLLKRQLESDVVPAAA